ncbi:MAG: DUF1553 domain-containing protein [Rubripirellula sp.]
MLRTTFTAFFTGTVLFASAHAQEVDFAKQILPILSDKCFVCHGPDSQEQSDLRLDSMAAATEDRGGYRAIDVEHPAKSAVLERIFSTDDPMPPQDAERQLNDNERELIRSWIEQGGQYASHWSYVPPIKSQSFASTTEAIDHFIGAPIKERELDFAPTAERATLARRIALLLTGLPPEQDQLKAFLSDDSGKAYEALVDSLLASPRFGEHQARYWLDAVRYGDTHGLHLDNRRGIYPYRDWVVRAMNQNLPVDDFITWQLAGDLLPEPTLEQLVATGYVRMNPSTGEGGAIVEEFQMKNNFDRVETFGTVFLGTSLTCARCHTHKYDPIQHDEYYKLLAFFNSTSESALDGNSYTYGPHARVPADQADWQRWDELSKRRERVIAEATEKHVDFQQAVEFAKTAVPWSTHDWRLSRPIQAGKVPTEKQWGDAKGLPGSVTGKAARGKLPKAEQEVWVTFNVTVPAEQSFDLSFAGAAGSFALVNGNNVPIAEKTVPFGAISAAVRLSKGTHSVRVVIRGRTNLNELQVTLASRWDMLAKTKRWDKCDQNAQLKMLADPVGPLFEPGSETSALFHDLVSVESNFTTSLIAKELPTPRTTRLLHRGEYSTPVGDPLAPDTLQVLNPFPESAPRTRVGLAQWLTSDANPLVARVLVNRIWQRMFGHALVRTPEEFGLQGEQPTHPELLDWLAVEFRQSGWDLKRLLRAMAMTRTFQQSSAYRKDVDDPENRLFARASAYRLDAEMLRDYGLWASGLLDPRMGGEGVKPYQPVGLWKALAHPASNTKEYSRDSGELLYRRSLYVYWKRTSPHPMMTLFDAPDRESSCVRRSRTNTPLQSLGMLNETQRIEMSRSLAQRLIRSSQTDAGRFSKLFQLLACRDVTDRERAACETLLAASRERYTRSPEDAQRLLAVGESARDESIDQVEHAAWTQVASTVLASDVAILLY